MKTQVRKLSDIIVYENERIIAVNKPAHLPSLHERFDTSVSSVLGLCRDVSQDYSLCHRLDRETSGIMLIAKDQEAYREISLQFEKRTVVKTYHAVVGASVQLDHLRVDLPLYTDGKRKVQVSGKKGKPSVTVFSTLRRFGHFSLLTCTPETGRLHQIRVHAAAQNLPLLADTLYGGQHIYLSRIKKNVKIGPDGENPLIDRVALHAFSIEFDCPSDGRMVIEAPYPKDFAVLLKLLEKYDPAGQG